MDILDVLKSRYAGAITFTLEERAATEIESLRQQAILRDLEIVRLREALAHYTDVVVSNAH
jgi:hypothetical protein